MSQSAPASALTWVVLTMGDRPEELEAAINSTGAPASVLVVSNGGGHIASHGAPCIELPSNLGIPGGRHAAVEHVSSPIVGFLDDDAALSAGIAQRVTAAFDADPRLGAVTLRLVDENGETDRSHVPRLGASGATDSGEVALFLGGACAIRRDAYLDAGGYFTDLFYGHEELELAWRLIDHGWTIRYLANCEVFHPRSKISRHAEGWRLTGRNRVWIARRTLPWAIAAIHVSIWLVLGVLRTSSGEERRHYLAGWRSGWKGSVHRAPIRWRTVWRLTRLGRPPVI